MCPRGLGLVLKAPWGQTTVALALTLALNTFVYCWSLMFVSQGCLFSLAFESNRFPESHPLFSCLHFSFFPTFLYSLRNSALFVRCCKLPISGSKLELRSQTHFGLSERIAWRQSRLFIGAYMYNANGRVLLTCLVKNITNFTSNFFMKHLAFPPFNGVDFPGVDYLSSSYNCLQHRSSIHLVLKNKKNNSIFA